jgi:hypothetical protein
LLARQPRAVCCYLLTLLTFAESNQPLQPDVRHGITMSVNFPVPASVFLVDELQMFLTGIPS